MYIFLFILFIIQYVLCTPRFIRYAYCPIYYLHNYDKLCIVYCLCLVKFEYLHIGVLK